MRRGSAFAAEAETLDGQVTTTGAVVKGKSSKPAFAAYMAALFVTLWAVILDVTMFATNDYASILIQIRSCR